VSTSAPTVSGSPTWLWFGYSVQPNANTGTPADSSLAHPIGRFTLNDKPVSTTM
ncbi:MAG: hypothetical protein HC817_09910, partial [Saprospiraceae bacterium]|nr:hypothetical protein [Saprospiraceae bacterium]